jgi:hypothetical protein
MQQVSDSKSGLPRAIAEANAFISKANAMSAALKPHNITLTVPATLK